MDNFRKFLRANSFYLFLTVFIITVNVLSFVAQKADKEARIMETGVTVEPEKGEKPSPMFDEESIKEREEKIKKLAEENPLAVMLLGCVNLIILLLIFLGLIFDLYFASRAIERKPVGIKNAFPAEPLWSAGDTVRAVLIFLSIGYSFMVFEPTIAFFFPVFENENFRMVFNTAFTNVIGISVIIYFVVNKYGQKIEDIGLTAKNMAKNILYGAVGYISLLPVLVGILALTFVVSKFLKYTPPVQPIVEVFLEEKATGVLLASTLFAAVFGPVAEEIFFRGFLYPAVRKKVGIFWAVVMTSAIFASLHAHLVGFLPIMALGILLAYIYEKTGSLVSSISVHIIHNVGMVALVFLSRAFDLV